MSWQVALVVDNNYSGRKLAALVHHLPVWAFETPERRAAAAAIRQSAGNLWAPDPAFTLFKSAGSSGCEDICRGVLWTLAEHHPALALLRVIGIKASDEFTEIFRAEGLVPAAADGNEGLGFRKPLAQLDDVSTLLMHASAWKTDDDVYESFFSAVGAPAWHGKNFDALHDSIVTGGINKIEVPYRLVVKNSRSIPASLSERVHLFRNLLLRFEQEGCPVTIEMS